MIAVLSQYVSPSGQVGLLFFQRVEWFRQHNLPYRRGYLFWGAPGNGKSATIRVMAAHPHIQVYTLDLSDTEEKSASVLHLFEKAATNAPALVIIEDLDRAFPTEGKRTRERNVSFQTLLNCLDGVGSQDGVIVVATALAARPGAVAAHRLQAVGHLV
jgi:chaperone BCS1